MLLFGVTGDNLKLVNGFSSALLSLSSHTGNRYTHIMQKHPETITLSDFGFVFDNTALPYAE